MKSDSELLAEVGDDGRPKHFPVERWGVSIPISVELLLGDQFPPRTTKTVHPVTDEDRAAYKAYKKRFKKARRRWHDVVAEGERMGWATWGGYEEDPSVLPLIERTEYEWLESSDEYRSRLWKIASHKEATGEWIEEPRPTFMGNVMNDMMAALTPADQVPEKKDSSQIA